MRIDTAGRWPARAFGRAVSAGILLLAVVPAYAESKIAVEQPWMRLIIKSRPAAGYMTLRNSGDKAVVLTGASSPACGMLMLHQSKQVNGVDTMSHVDSLAIPAHGTVAFAPGGYHLMCMQPQSGMEMGKSVPVTLDFQDGEKVTAQFPVKGPGGK